MGIQVLTEGFGQSFRVSVFQDISLVIALQLFWPVGTVFLACKGAMV